MNHRTDLRSRETRRVRSGAEYSRLLTAAVINEQFRKELLSNPGRALTLGYEGEEFAFSPEEEERLAAIHVNSLPEFASRLLSL